MEDLLCAKIKITSMREIVLNLGDNKAVGYFMYQCLHRPVTKEDLYVVFDSSPRIFTEKELLEKYTLVGGHTELKPTMIWFSIEEKDAVASPDPDRSTAWSGGGEPA